MNEELRVAADKATNYVGSSFNGCKNNGEDCFKQWNEQDAIRDFVKENIDKKIEFDYYNVGGTEGISNYNGKIKSSDRSLGAGPTYVEVEYEKNGKETKEWFFVDRIVKNTLKIDKKPLKFDGEKYSMVNEEAGNTTNNEKDNNNIQESQDTEVVVPVGADEGEGPTTPKDDTIITKLKNEDFPNIDVKPESIDTDMSKDIVNIKKNLQTVAELEKNFVTYQRMYTGIFGKSSEVNITARQGKRMLKLTKESTNYSLGVSKLLTSMNAGKELGEDGVIQGIIAAYKKVGKMTPELLKSDSFDFAETSIGGKPIIKSGVTDKTGTIKASALEGAILIGFGHSKFEQNIYRPVFITKNGELTDGIVSTSLPGVNYFTASTQLYEYNESINEDNSQFLIFKTVISRGLQKTKKLLSTVAPGSVLKTTASTLYTGMKGIGSTGSSIGRSLGRTFKSTKYGGKNKHRTLKQKSKKTFKKYSKK